MRDKARSVRMRVRQRKDLALEEATEKLPSNSNNTGFQNIPIPTASGSSPRAKQDPTGTNSNTRIKARARAPARAPAPREEPTLRIRTPKAVAL